MKKILLIKRLNKMCHVKFMLGFNVESVTIHSWTLPMKFEFKTAIFYKVTNAK